MSIQLSCPLPDLSTGISLYIYVYIYTVYMSVLYTCLPISTLIQVFLWRFPLPSILVSLSYQTTCFSTHLSVKPNHLSLPAYLPIYFYLNTCPPAHLLFYLAVSQLLSMWLLNCLQSLYVHYFCPLIS